MNLADMFTVASLTAAVNKLPLPPSAIGGSGLFAEQGINSTTVVIDEQAGRLVLVPNTSRNDEARPLKDPKRKRRVFETCHLPLSTTLLPADLQGLQAFGQEVGVAAQQATVINDRLASLKASIETTREWQRMGAIAGQVLDADGSVLVDLFDAFAITKKSISIAFTTATTDVRGKCVEAVRHSESKLLGTAASSYRAYCSPQFLDALVSHATVKEAFANYQQAADRLGGDVRRGFVFGGIEFIEYNQTVSGQKFVADGKARLFPLAPRVFALYNAPANYNETVNTVGQAWYAKAEPRRLGKGWDLEVQANPLALCLYPEALVELVAA